MRNTLSMRRKVLGSARVPRVRDREDALAIMQNACASLKRLFGLVHIARPSFEPGELL